MRYEVNTINKGFAVNSLEEGFQKMEELKNAGYNYVELDRVMESEVGIYYESVAIYSK